MAEVDVRERTPMGPQPEVAGLSAALTRLSERAGQRAWPTAKALARPLGLFVVSRIAIALAIGLVIDLNLGLATQHFNGPWPTNPPGGRLFEALGMWDGGWYMRIAHDGYTTSLHPLSAYTPTVAFLPVLPVLLRITIFITGLNTLYAGVLTSALIGAVASVCVWFFVRRLTDRATADRATALWCFFPGAMTLSLVYTEGLLVVFAVVCLYALMRGWWVIAGVAAAAASATSPEGLALFACCAWAAGAAILRRPDEAALGQQAISAPARPGRRWLALVAPLLAPLGWLTYQGYLWRRTGDLTIWYLGLHRNIPDRQADQRLAPSRRLRLPGPVDRARRARRGRHPPVALETARRSDDLRGDGDGVRHRLGGPRSPTSLLHCRVPVHRRPGPVHPRTRLSRAARHLGPGPGAADVHPRGGGVSLPCLHPLRGISRFGRPPSG